MRVMLMAIPILLQVATASGSVAVRPNLMFMMTDQQRHDTMSLVTPSLSTPNMDRIAKEGVLFKWGYSSTPTCTPARAAILTGQKPWNHGSLGAVGVAHEYPFEMPVTLAALGYSTTSIGKDHFGWVSGGPDGGIKFDTPDARTCLNSAGELEDLQDGDTAQKGFPPPYGPDVGYGVPHGYQQTSLYDGIVAENDDYHQWFKREMGGKEPESGWPQLDMNSWRGEAYAYANESLHPTAWVGQQAVDFITNRAPFISNASLKDAPWFLKVSFHRPHSPYDPPQRFIDRTPLSSLRPVYTCAKDDPLGWDSIFSENSNGCGPENLDAWCGAMPANDSAFARRCYQANILFIDEWVGKILDALTTTAQLENTYIVWAGDHGDGQSDHYHWRKGFPYEFASHVPWMMRWPKNAGQMGQSRAEKWKRGVVIEDAVVELRDIFPTMLDAIGRLNGPQSVVPHDYKMDGDSLLCLLGGGGCRGGQWRPYLDLEHYKVYNETVHWNAIHTGEMKFIFHAFWPDGDPRQFQLFNLSADPHELRDLARSNEPQHVAELEKLKKVMANQFLEEGRDKYGFVTPEGKLLGDSHRTLTGTSPNYPAPPPPVPGADDCSADAAAALGSGDGLVLGKSSKATCQEFTWVKETQSLALIRVLGHSLCIAPNATAVDGTLVLARCPGTPGGVSTAASGFLLAHNNTGSATWNSHHMQQIIHKASGKCIHGGSGATPMLSECDAEDLAQSWVFGSSGRLCGQGGCLGASADRSASLTA